MTQHRPSGKFLNRKKRDEEKAYDARRRKAAAKVTEAKKKEAEAEAKKKGIEAPQGDATTIAQRMGFWASQGFDHAEHKGGVRIQDGDSCTLYDYGNRIFVHGSPSDEALAAMASRAAEHWNSKARVLGGWEENQPSKDADRYWLACQRAGVEVTNYTPSEEYKELWKKEKDTTGAVAEHAQEVAALQKLAAGADHPSATESMRQYVEGMDSKEARKLAEGHPAEVAAKLENHRAKYPDEGDRKGRVHDMASEIAKPVEDGHEIPPPGRG